MIERVVKTIERHNLLQLGRRTGVAVSGGADSVFLLHILHELGLATQVLHVNHKLRAAESDADEQFVRDLARKLGLPIAVTAASLAEGNVEQEARRARYAFFEQQVAAGLCDTVATGHTLDDQAETVLYRLLRGAGTTGLSGIRISTESGLIRPLLESGREEIRAWLKERAIPWREDTSNLDLDFARNRLRHEVIPRLAELNPAVSAILAQTAVWAAGEEDYWNAETARLANQWLDQSIPETVQIDVRGFRTLPAAVQRRLLRLAIGIVRGGLRSIDFRHVEVIRALMDTEEGSGRVQIPGLDACRSFDWLRLAPMHYDNRVPRNFELPLTIPGVTTVPDRPIAIVTEQVVCPDVYNSVLGCPEFDRENCFDPDHFAGTFLLRNWQPGDRIETLTGSGVEKIKTLFQEFRVPLWERRNWPVVEAVADSERVIVWCRRFGVARKFSVGPNSRRAVRIEESNSARKASTE